MLDYLFFFLECKPTLLQYLFFISLRSTNYYVASFLVQIVGQDDIRKHISPRTNGGDGYSLLIILQYANTFRGYYIKAVFNNKTLV